MRSQKKESASLQEFVGDLAVIPNLLNFTQNAFNAKDGNFLGSPVFVISYGKGKKVNWNGTEKLIPDQVSVDTTTRHYEDSNSLILQNKADYDDAFSTSIGAEYSGITYSGSVQSSFMYHGNLFTQTDSFYSLNSYIQCLLTFERLRGNIDLTDEFKNDLAALPKEKVEKAYFDFFDKYGTHILMQGTLGGKVIMETQIKESLLKTATTMETSLAIQAGYEGMIASGKLDVSAAYRSSSFLSENRNSIGISLSTEGGIYTSDGKISEWVTSCYETPSIVLNTPNVRVALTTMNAISFICSDQIKASNINALLKDYLMKDAISDGLISSPRKMDINTVSQATGDGFLISTVKEVNNGDRSYSLSFEDNNDNPTTLRVCASQHFFTTSDIWVPFASCSLPVPNHEYFRNRFVQTAGNPAIENMFIGMGDQAQASLLQYSEITQFGSPLTADADGFVIGYVDWNQKNGARSYMKASIVDISIPVMGCSQHRYTDSDTYVPCNSFCMPVVQGTKYRLDFEATAENPTKAAYFVPLGKRLWFFDKMRSRTENTTYLAQSDGFLMGYIYYNNDGDRGFINAYSHADKSLLLTKGLMTSTSIHYFTGSDHQIGQNSLMIPVAKGNYYHLEIVSTAGKCNVQVNWVAIGSKP